MLVKRSWRITSPLWAKGSVFSEPLTLLCWPLSALLPNRARCAQEGHFLFPSQQASLNMESGRGAEKVPGNPISRRRGE